MPARPTKRFNYYEQLSIREGLSPIGLYWGIPLAVAAGLLCLTATPWMKPGWPRTLLPPIAAVLVFAALFFFTWRHYRWDCRNQRGRMTALDALITMIASMGTEEGTETLTLQRLPLAVNALLGMKFSCVGLLEDQAKTFHIVASSGISPSPDGRRLPLDEIPNTQRAIAGKYVVAVADTLHPDRPINSTLAREWNLRAMVHIPMVYRDEVLGVMVLGDDRPRSLTDWDLRRAWMWGCMAAVLLSHCRLYRTMSKSLLDQRTLMGHRDALFELLTTIQRPGTLEEILQRIVELAPGTLDVDAAMIWLLDEEDHQFLYMAAATTPYEAIVAGYRLPIAQSVGGAVFNTGRAVVIEDGPADPALNSNLKKRLPHGSLILEPLVGGDGKVLGVIVLMRREVSPFRRDQLEMAHMLTVRAAAVLEMARLHQQTVSDAEAKAMLLRELNHRVKNNLTAIITLLSINPPAMSRDARRWLDRAINRIEAMAQVHDLFSVGAQRVTLAELVERTVRSLSVVKPAGVTINTDLLAGKALLRTDRAVTVAMAMHELCFNGLVHGLRESGTLTIRASRANGQLAIEVENDAGHPSGLSLESEGANGHSGIGLSLVRGLVGRELRGQFTLAATGGGARARVEFPLLADELIEAAL